MRSDFDNKTGLLVVRMILFSSALFVLLAGIGAAFFLQAEQDASGGDLEKLAIIAAVFSPIALVAMIAGKSYLAGLLESRSGEAKLQILIGGSSVLAGICEAPGLLWAVCAFMQSEPLYAIGSVVHAFGILYLWPDGAELEERMGGMTAEGDE